jgi:hypothetical protein
MSCALLVAATHNNIYRDSLILRLSRELSSNSCKILPADDSCKLISRAQKIEQLERVPKKIKNQNCISVFSEREIPINNLS